MYEYMKINIQIYKAYGGINFPIDLISKILTKGTIFALVVS